MGGKKTLQEQFTNEKKERENDFTSQISKIKQKKKNVEERIDNSTDRIIEDEDNNKSMKTRILKLKTENIRLSEQKTVTTKAQEDEVEKEEIKEMTERQNPGATQKRRDF